LREARRPPAAPQPLPGADKVVLYADLSETDEAEGCDAIIRGVRDAAKRGSPVLDVDARNPSGDVARYRLLAAPGVLFLDDPGGEVAGLEGESTGDGSRHPRAVLAVLSALPEAFEAALSAGGAAAVPRALLGGLVSGPSPCCLAFYPAVTATRCVAVGQRSPALGSLAAFVVGTASMSTLAGVAAALAGHAVLVLGRGPRYALACVPLLMGLHRFGWLRLPLPAAPRWPGAVGVAGAFLAGSLLSLVLGACGTPVFAALLSYAAYTGSVGFGAVLLFAYGIGSGLPLLLAGHRATRGPLRRGRLAAKPRTHLGRPAPRIRLLAARHGPNDPSGGSSSPG
jgi:cytochrome c-type biogenesis protein